jgi:predicted secreted Zn-dependent protease
MIQKFLTVFICSFIFLSFTAKDDGDYIDWNPERKLKWQDFKAASPENTADAALTTTYVGFSYNKSNDEIKYNIECRFQKSKSWGKIKTDYILQHEQGHFDISEIAARKLNKLIQEQLSKSKNHDELNKIYRTVMQEKRDMQELYDRESNHSINKEKQDEWETKIKTMLEELKSFSGYNK